MGLVDAWILLTNSCSSFFELVYDMIRRFFPKGTNFKNVTKKRIQEVQDFLNGYERKILDWQTPQELWSYCS